MMVTNDEATLTPSERRRFLLWEIEHQRLLVSDARVLKLTAIHARRRDKLRHLEEQLATLDATGRQTE